MGSSVEPKLIEDLESVLARQQAAVSKGQAAIRDLIREMHEALCELESRETQCTEAATKLSDETADRLKALQSALATSASAEHAAKKELETAHARIAELEERAGNAPALKEQVTALEQQCASLQEEVNRQAGLLVEAEKAHKRLHKVELAYKEQTDALQAGQAARRRVAELETTVDEYKQAAHAEQQRVGELREAIEAARARESELSRRVAEFEAKDIGRISGELAQAQAALAESTQQAKQFAAQVKRLTVENERLEKNVAELDEEVSTRGEALNQVRERLETLETEKRAQTAEFEDVCGRARDVAESERSLRAQLDELRSSLTETGVRLESTEQDARKAKALEAEAATLKRRNAKLEDELKTERAKGSKSQLASQLSEALRERDAAEETIRGLREQLDGKRSGDVPPVELDRSQPAELDEEVFVPTDENLNDARRLLGEIFVEAGVISTEQLDRALSIQESDRPTRRLGEVLVALGYTAEEEVAQALARQRGLKFLKLEPGSIDHEAAHLISPRLAEMHMCIPVRVRGEELLVAMENPLDLIAIEDVERASERRVRPVVATISAIQAAIAKVYAPERQRA